MSSICIIGASGDMDAEVLKKKLQEMGILGVDAQLVCGKDHLIAAAACAEKAFSDGRNECSTLQMEIMLYASGEKQISKAAAKMSIKDSRKTALVIFGKNADEVLSELNMKRNDALLESSEEKLRTYGISIEELKSVPAGKENDLVLEHVAFAAR